MENQQRRSRVNTEAVEHKSTMLTVQVFVGMPCVERDAGSKQRNRLSPISTSTFHAAAPCPYVSRNWMAGSTRYR